MAHHHMRRSVISTGRPEITWKAGNLEVISFGRRATPHPRQCVFIGTTNAENGYLRDTAGNRRFWPVKTPGDAGRASWEMTEEEIRQIWAEALVRYKEGEPLHLDNELAGMALKEQQIAMEVDEREGIPTRYLYHRLNSDNFPDRQPQVRVKRWDGSAVKDIITNETYLGTLLWNRSKCGMDTGKKRVVQPRETWIIVEGQHEALVTKELYDKANENIIGLDVSGRAAGKKNPFFICGHCGKTLKHRNRANDKYFCRSGTQQVENDCQKVNVRKKGLEDAVLGQVRVMADMLLEERDARQKTHKDVRREELETAVSDATKEMSQWKGAKVHLYEQYKAGEISREDYMERIERGRARMEGLEQSRREAQMELDRMQEMAGSEEIPDEELAGLSVLETFDVDRLKALIEKVVVYEEDAIEIVWKVRNPFDSEVSV